jgi:cysteinyl-tRNA synthetase
MFVILSQLIYTWFIHSYFTIITQVSKISMTEIKDDSDKYSDTKSQQNSLNDIKLFDTWNNKYFTVKPGSRLRTYICGPTVYSETHIGHIKTYMSFDIVRRVLEDYFKIPMTVTENVTDVDDKIIRATYQKFYGNEIIPDDYDLHKLDPSMYLDNKHFLDYANGWEIKFFDTMDKMKVKRPNVVGRVTEYINEILEFVEDLHNKGHAFAHDGSVYFYGTKYNNIVSDEYLALNEAGREISEDWEKYSQDPSKEHNFSLLKKVRPYEPGWQSKYGVVRPSWHIECSAIGSSIYGHNFDIHLGGIDLHLHHHNEMQQSNARYKLNESDPEWVDHFMHMGHLNIEGLKMSRSLKNFITVAEIMEKYSHNQIRMLFLLHTWADPMDYSDETMKHATFFTELFKNFFLQTKSILLRPTTKHHKKFGPHEIQFYEYLEKIKLSVDSSLRSNINTPNVIKLLQELVGSLFTHIMTVEKSETYVSEEIINDTIYYIKSILDVFGLDSFDDMDNSDNGLGDNLLKVIYDIRYELRDIAKNIVTKVKPLDKSLAIELRQSIFNLTDKVRDQVLPSLGIHLTD